MGVEQMQLWRVRDVMSTDVVSVHEDAPLYDIIGLLNGRRVEIVPVVDKVRRVVGVICPADLRRRGDWSATALAGDVMSAPAWTIDADASLAMAAQRMYLRKVERLPVTADGGRLVGVVSVTDLLRVFGRPDTDIRRDLIEQVLRRTLHINPERVHVAVDSGTVTLVGTVERRTTAEALARLAHTVPGVVSVVSLLSYEYDDTPFVQDVEAAADAAWLDWPQRLLADRRPEPDGRREPDHQPAWWAEPSVPERGPVRVPAAAGSGR